MGNKNRISVLSAVLIAAVVLGCVQEISEIGTSDAAQPALASKIRTTQGG